MWNAVRGWDRQNCFEKKSETNTFFHTKPADKCFGEIITARHSVQWCSFNFCTTISISRLTIKTGLINRA